MVKTAGKLTVMVCLVLALSSCAQENRADTAATKNTSKQVLRIAAAANLSDVLPQIVDGYKTARNLSEQDIEVTYASSGKLYAQIIAGAPYDIFLSANQSFPAKLAKDKVVNEPSHAQKAYQPFTYTQGQLALYSVTKSLKNLNQVTLIDLFMVKDASSKVAIANPELAPYGESAIAYLQSQQAYDSLNEQKRLIQAENIGQAFQYAHTGSVDYGFVAQSQLVAIKATAEQSYTLASGSYPPILQDGIVIGNGDIATDFTDYLLSLEGQQYFSHAGYLAVHQ